jgi:molybdopterin-guanine dinucleotide biosynthesis protein A
VSSHAHSSARLYGLVLAGGRSSRMQRDKAQLNYHGHSQLEHACRLLAPHVDKVFVSVREDHRDDPQRAAWPQIVDRPGLHGPIAGIASAQATYPDAAWWVLACDLPFLDDQTLRALDLGRSTDRLATAFRSAHDGLPEPLCAIYEPASAAAISTYVAGGGQCPRKFLGSHDTHLLTAPNPTALDNINTPQEYAAAMSALQSTSAAPSTLAATAKNLRVQYFALLRDQAGRSQEQLVSKARTAAELFAELGQRYPFTLRVEQLRVAINAEFAEWHQELRDGDEVVFIPPVAGG